MKSVVVRLALAVCAILVPVLGFASPIAHLTLSSQPGDFIGQGGTFDITYQAPTDMVIAQIRRQLPDNSPTELLFELDDASPAVNEFALLFFGTDQLGIPIQPGTYPLAQRADFAQPGHPGLDVSFQNRGSNTVVGSFTIDDVSFFVDAFGTESVDRFKASFEQHSEGATPALFGTFEYARNGELTPVTAVPEPSTLLLSLVGGAVAFGRRRGRAERQRFTR